MLAPDGDWIGLALRATPHGDFVSTATAHGGADLFAAALVLRCPARMVRRGRVNTGRILRTGPLRADAWPEPAVTVGPPFPGPAHAAITPPTRTAPPATAPTSPSIAPPGCS
ncbi:hypothetical protein ACFWBX_13300 [Streptomyces sp. NPDC059991]|uniref:hypothetical protein n=1 Tax=Streptomyces sp. NPDC059991 TaxID=3347028 RepID=UPI0036803D6C